MIEATISLDKVEAALIARRIARYQAHAGPRRGCRWAAMSAHVQTNDCNRRSGAWRFAMPSMMSPLHAGYIARVVERVRLREGLQAVRSTWGMGYRAMQAETASVVMR